MAETNKELNKDPIKVLKGLARQQRIKDGLVRKYKKYKNPNGYKGIHGNSDSWIPTLVGTDDEYTDESEIKRYIATRVSRGRTRERKPLKPKRSSVGPDGPGGRPYIPSISPPRTRSRSPSSHRNDCHTPTKVYIRNWGDVTLRNVMLNDLENLNLSEIVRSGDTIYPIVFEKVPAILEYNRRNPKNPIVFVETIAEGQITMAITFRDFLTNNCPRSMGFDIFKYTTNLCTCDHAGIKIDLTDIPEKYMKIPFVQHIHKMLFVTPQQIKRGEHSIFITQGSD